MCWYRSGPRRVPPAPNSSPDARSVKETRIVDQPRFSFGGAWRGELSLPFTYWLLGVGGNMSFVAALVVLYVVLGLDGLPLLWLLYLASLAWFVFIFGAIWRAAGAYPGPRLWTFLARAGICIGTPRMAAEAWLLLNLPELALRIPSKPF